MYIGVTSDLITRIHEHKTKVFSKSFSHRYNLEKLIFYEIYPSIEEAIVREKQLKEGSRKQKLSLINAMNPGWKDLYEDIMNNW